MQTEIEKVGFGCAVVLGVILTVFGPLWLGLGILGICLLIALFH